MMSYWCVNSVGAIVSLLTTTDYANVIAGMISIFYSTLSGFIGGFPYGLQVLSYAFWNSQSIYNEYYAPVAGVSDPPYARFNYDASWTEAGGIGVQFAMAIIYHVIMLGLLLRMASQ